MVGQDHVRSCSPEKVSSDVLCQRYAAKIPWQLTSPLTNQHPSTEFLHGGLKWAQSIWAIKARSHMCAGGQQNAGAGKAHVLHPEPCCTKWPNAQRDPKGDLPSPTPSGGLCPNNLWSKTHLLGPMPSPYQDWYSSYMPSSSHNHNDFPGAMKPQFCRGKK